MTTTDPLWKGRIEGAPDPAFFAFQRSLPYDARLLPQDLQVNAAWARALGRAGLLAPAEVEQLETALAEIGRGVRTPPPVRTMTSTRRSCPS